MRFSLLILLALVSFAVAGNPPPMSFKDISLMLRSGYSSDAVGRELAARHFIGTLDAAGEKNLVQAGASPALISGLKSGTFAIPASEVAAVQAELAAKTQRRAAVSRISSSSSSRLIVVYSVPGLSRTSRAVAVATSFMMA